MTISAVGVFSGCGGFDLGAAANNMVAAYDSDPVAVKYRHNVSENIKCMVIEDKCPPCLPNQADLLIGGPPVKAFECWAKLASDPRNELWRNCVGILKLKPKAFVA